MDPRPSRRPATGAPEPEVRLDELRARGSAARASEEGLAALLEAVAAVSADLELSEVLGRIVRAACSLVDARYAALGVLARDGEGLADLITHGVGEGERSLIGDPPFGFPPDTRSRLGTPVRIRDRVFGHLHVAGKRGASEFSGADATMLVAFATAAGVAIENAQLFERSERQRTWSEAIGELARMLLESEDEDSALDWMVVHARRFASAGFAAVALTDDVGDLIVRAVDTVGEDDAPGPGGPAPPPLNLPGALEAGKALQGAGWQAVGGARQPLLLLPETATGTETETATGTATATGDEVGDEHGERLARSVAQSLSELNPHGPTAILPIALSSGGLGVLVLGWRGDVPGSSAETMTAVADFAQQAALALVAARAQRDRSRMALLEDRERIARDMHDHVIQRLFATGLSLQSAARVAQHPLVRARLDDAVDELDESIRHIRHTIFELHRPIPTGGLRAELHGLADDAAASLGFAPRLAIEGALGGLAESLEADIVAVVREGLSNIARHARASTADVEITAGDRIRITVTDDGVGTDPGLARSGLVNLGSRAAARSGTFDVRPGDPHGTVLCWEVPGERRG